MRNLRTSARGLVGSVCLAWLALEGEAVGGFESVWNASSGLTPDQISIPYTLADSADPEDPALRSAFLTLSTSTNSEFQYYYHSGGELDVSGAFFMEARLRFVSGTSSDASRGPFAITFTTSSQVGNSLYINKDEVFFNIGNLVKGPTATVDTDDAFHTYRIDVTSAGALTLQYDGGLILAGQTFNSLASHGTRTQIAWGEYSALASGTAEWSSFRHNALANDPATVPEPSSVLLTLLGAAGVLGYALPRMSQSRPDTGRRPVSG